MLTPRQLADAVDEIERDIAALTASRKELYTTHREDLEASGMDKANILVEMAALKAAIAKRRKLRSEKGETVRSQDERADEILVEIMAEAPKPAASTNTAPVVSSLSPATVGQGNHADDARSDASSLDGTAVLLPGQSSEAGPEQAGGEVAPDASPQRPSLNDIAGDYRPTPVLRLVDEEEGIPDFLRRA